MGGGPATLGPGKHYFQGFFGIITRFTSLKSCFFKLFALSEDWKACRMIKSLRKVDFSLPAGYYIWKISPPLEKILGGPLYGPNVVWPLTFYTKSIVQGYRGRSLISDRLSLRRRSFDSNRARTLVIDFSNSSNIFYGNLLQYCASFRSFGCS